MSLRPQGWGSASFGGGISLLLALLGFQILPIGFVGLGLIPFGVLLMVLDAFTPTDGVLPVGGVVSLLIGSFSLFELEGTPLRLSWITVAATVGTLTLVFLFIASKGLLAPAAAAATPHDDGRALRGRQGRPPA